MVNHMDSVIQQAYAKVNLGLDVLRKRADGYHEVKMVMQTVGLHDTLEFGRMKEPGISLSVNVDQASEELLPRDHNNLIYRAARLIMDSYSIQEGIAIHLDKKIPIAAGLAGGSTDAAAVFRGMNELFELGMTQERMCGLGVRIGADVPYCVLGGAALAEGIGERLSPLEVREEILSDCCVLLAKPDISVSTRSVYEGLTLTQDSRHPDIDAMVRELRDGKLTGLCSRMGNLLESVTIPRYPQIGRIKEFMIQQGALGALMSGSGPTVYGIFPEEEQARAACGRLRQAGLAGELYLTAFR